MTIKTPDRYECRNCGRQKDEHVNDKCLFEATTYRGYTDEEWARHLGTLALEEVTGDIAKDPSYWNLLPEDNDDD